MNLPDYSEVERLRLELGRERDRANAFEAALRKEVLAVIRQAAEVYKPAEDAELCKLRAEVGDYYRFIKWEGLGVQFDKWKEWYYQKSDGGPAKEGGAS